jgi:hypothetical protein
MSETKSTRICPFCQEEINVAAIRCKHCHSWSSAGHHGVCPLCKEQIHPEASRCKHCQADLSSNPSVTYASARQGRQIAIPLTGISRSKDGCSSQSLARMIMPSNNLLRQGQCSACPSVIIEVTNGGASAWEFSGCDETYCYYTYGSGIV